MIGFLAVLAVLTMAPASSMKRARDYVKKTGPLKFVFRSLFNLNLLFFSIN